MATVLQLGTSMMYVLIASLAAIIVAPPVSPTFPGQIGLPANEKLVGPVDIAPTGWRRTVRGWERADYWPVSDPSAQMDTLNRVIKKQRSAERGWTMGRILSNAMEFVRKISPVTLVCSQVTLLALYVALVLHRESKIGNRQCLKPTQLSR